MKVLFSSERGRIQRKRHRSCLTCSFNWVVDGTVASKSPSPHRLPFHQYSPLEELLSLKTQKQTTAVPLARQAPKAISPVQFIVTILPWHSACSILLGEFSEFDFRYFGEFLRSCENLCIGGRRWSLSDLLGLEQGSLYGFWLLILSFWMSELRESLIRYTFYNEIIR